MAKQDQPIQSEELSRKECGDQEQFLDAYHRLRLPLFSYINRLLPGNPTLADDVFQTVWLKAYRNWGNHQEEKKIFYWLCRIAHNATADLFRRKPGIDSLDSPDENGVPLYGTLEDPRSEGNQMLEEIDQKNLSELLSQAILKLPPDQQQIILLRRQGIPFQEIASRQGKNLNTVLGRMHTAITKIRTIMMQTKGGLP